MTFLVRRALAAQAIAGVAAHFIPDAAVSNCKIQFAARSVSRRLAPLVDLTQLKMLLFSNKQVVGAADGRAQPPEADVVAPALGQHGRKLERDYAVEQRNVLLSSTVPAG